MTQLHMAFLGGFHAEFGGCRAVIFLSNRARALLAYLAVEYEHAHSREELAELLWPEYSQEAAQSNLRNTLSGLRDSLGDRAADPPYLLVTRESVEFNRAADAGADVWAFAEGGHVELYRGPFLQGFYLADSAGFEDWVRRVRARLEEDIQARLDALVREAEACGAYAPALKYARRQLELEPWREEAHRAAMRALALQGQRSAALVQYEYCKRTLAEELGVEPEEATRRLRDAIAAERFV